MGSDILSEFAIHVGTAAVLPPTTDNGKWHRNQADWREKELRDFIGAMAAELRLVETSCPERRAVIDALLEAHPVLTNHERPRLETGPAPNVHINAWVCPKCNQLNSAGSGSCGRCEDI